VLREQHRFVWTDDDLAEMDWEKEQAHKYYEKLFKEYVFSKALGSLKNAKTCV
jgi:hypothetical protein